MSEAGPPPDNIEPAPAPADPAPQVGFMRVLRYFLRLGTIGFGGPIATVGYMQRDLVEQRGWIDRRNFLDGVALGQTMPGPLAAQVAMWVGYLRRGPFGAAAVAAAFVAPSFLMVVVVGAIYARYSGLAVVQSMRDGVVAQHHWLTGGQFLDAVAMGLITPGPVVITAGFIGYLVAGLPGAIVASVAIFAPIYLGVVVPGRWFLRHRDNPQIKAFVSGATAAAAGALSGAVVVLTRQAVTDWPALAIALVTLVVLWRFKVGEPYVVLAAGALGILIH